MPAVAVHFPDLATPGPVGPALLLPDPSDVQPGPAAPNSNKFDPLESVKSGVAEALAAPTLAWPGLLSVLGALGGYAAFGLASVAFQAPDFHAGTLPFSVFVAPLPIALVSTQVSLAVGHQWFRLRGRPEDLPRASALAWVGGGRLALGLVPLLIWFATTGDPTMFRTLCTFLSVALGAATLFGAGGRMRDAMPSRPDNVAQTDLFVAGWFLLTGAIFLLLCHQLS